MSEVATVMWKEWREHFLRRGRPSRTVIATLIVVLLAGVVGPLTLGYLLNEAGGLPRSKVGFLVDILAVSGLVAAAFQGLLVTSSLIIDAFAGERERHTLETLLAGPLSDRAVLYGKILAIQLFVMASAFAQVLAQQVVTLFMVGAPGLGYAPVLLAGPVLALLVGLLVGSVGAIIGMRAATVKNGQQVLAYVLLPLYLLPSFGHVLLLGTPVGRAIVGYFEDVGPVMGLLTGMGILAALDAILLAVARQAFRRDRLLLRK